MCVAACLLEGVTSRQGGRVHCVLQIAPQRIRACTIDGESRHADEHRQHDGDEHDGLTALALMLTPRHQYSVLKMAAAVITMRLAVAWAITGVIRIRLKRNVT